MNNDKEEKMPDISKTIANYHVSSGGYMLSKETSRYLIYQCGWMDGSFISSTDFPPKKKSRFSDKN